LSPRARRKLDVRKIARKLGGVVVGPAEAAGGYFGARNLAAGTGHVQPAAPAPASETPAPLVSEPACIFPVKGRYCGTCAACFRRLYGPEWYLR